MAAAKKVGAYSERSPYAAANSSTQGNAACGGPAESGTSLVVGSRQAAPGRVTGAVAGAAFVTSASPAPNSVDSTIAVAGEAGGGGGPLGEERRPPGGGDVRGIGSVSQEQVGSPCTGGRHRDEGRGDVLATAQTKQNTGVRFDVENTALPANATAHRAGALPPLGNGAGQEGGRRQSVAATPVTGIAGVSIDRGCGHGVAAPFDTPGGKTSSPGSSSEGAAVAADPGPIAAAVTLRRAKGSANGTEGYSGGENVAGISREGGVFGGDPEVTVSAAPGV